MHDAVVLGMVRLRTLRRTTNAIPSVGCRAAGRAHAGTRSGPVGFSIALVKGHLENIVGSSHGVRRTITKSVTRDRFCFEN